MVEGEIQFDQNEMQFVHIKDNSSMVESGRCEKSKAADVKAADVAESGRCWAKAADDRSKAADVCMKAADVAESGRCGIKAADVRVKAADVCKKAADD